MGKWKYDNILNVYRKGIGFPHGIASFFYLIIWKRYEDTSLPFFILLFGSDMKTHRFLFVFYNSEAI